MTTFRQPAAAPNGAAPGHRRAWAYGALAGIVSAGVLLAAGELLSLVFGGSGSPVLAIGSFVIDIFPAWAKDLVIALFGTSDKIVLLFSLALAVVVSGAVAGVLQLTKPPAGIVVVAIAGSLSVAAILTRAGATPDDAIPTTVGTILAGYVIHASIARLRRWLASPAPDAAADGAAASTIERRSFVRFTLIAGAAAAVIGTGSRLASSALASIAALRESLVLPSPGNTVVVPAGADLAIPGISPLFVPNADFYRIDTALTVPVIDPSTWSLTIDGLVGRRVTLGFQDLLDMGLDEYSITLACVSNEVGGPLIGNARWLGLPIRKVLAMAGPTEGADMVLSRSVDGFTAGTPLGVLTDPNVDAILAVGMNGEPLPLEHGFPVRMVVPGLYGYVSATKWLTELTVTTFAADLGYWTPRGWDALGPVKLSSRLDTPVAGRTVPAGSTKLAGVAWAQPTGLLAVEVRVDDGDWQSATLAESVGDDSWVQWFIDWEATPGSHTVVVRATDKNGVVQLEQQTPVAPNGATGWHSSLVVVG